MISRLNAFVYACAGLRAFTPTHPTPRWEKMLVYEQLRAKFATTTTTTKANYMSSTGSACGLDGAVAVSGSSCLAMNAAFTHARRLWQPLLVRELKATFVAPCPPEKLEERGVDLAAVRDAKDLVRLALPCHIGLP